MGRRRYIKPEEAARARLTGLATCPVCGQEVFALCLSHWSATLNHGGDAVELENPFAHSLPFWELGPHVVRWHLARSGHRSKLCPASNSSLGYER